MPGIWITPRSSTSRASRRTSALAGSGTGPPHMPLCSGWSSAAHAHVGDHEPAQAGRDRRQAGVEVRRVGEHDHVRVEPRAVRAQERLEVRRADLLLALDDQLHVAGQPPVRGETGAQRRHVHHESGLVVDDAAPVEPAVRAQRRLERRGEPLLGAARRLHVVVRVDQHGRRARRRRGATRRRRTGARRAPQAPPPARARSRAAAPPTACAERSSSRGSKPAADTPGMRASSRSSASVRSKSRVELRECGVAIRLSPPRARESIVEEAMALTGSCLCGDVRVRDRRSARAARRTVTARCAARRTARRS